MAKYIRDYKVTFLIAREGNNKLIYTSIDKVNPLHVTFSVGYEEGKPESKMELNIYNMSPASRKLLANEDVKVMLEVGTRDTTKSKVSLNKLFLGTVSEPLSTNTSASDHVTRIKANSGFEITSTQIGVSLEPGATKRKVIETICSEIESNSGGMLRFNLSYIQEGGDYNNTRTAMMKELDAVTKTGYSYTGTADTALRDVLRNFNLEYSMRTGGEIKVHKRGHTESSDLFTLTLDNGLLTVPQPVANKASQSPGDPRKTKGFTFKSLITPQIKINDRISVKHPQIEIKKNLIVQKIKFSGGYEASHWYSTIQANFESEEDAEKSIAENKLSSEQDVNYYKLLTEG